MYTGYFTCNLSIDWQVKEENDSVVI